jgi:hypothetical protein
MPAPKGNQYAKANKGGGRPAKYRPEYAEQARKLCQLGLTDEGLANFFGVDERTINRWKIEREEFLSALRIGKEVADDIVERSTFIAIAGHTKRVKKIVGHGKAKRVEKVEEYHPPQAGNGLKWLAARKPHIYRQQAEQTQKLDIGKVWLKVLEDITERGKREQIEHKQFLIDRANAIDLEVEPVDAK